MKHALHHLTVEQLGAVGLETDAATQRHIATCLICCERLAEFQRVRDDLASTANTDLTPSRVLTEGALAQLQQRKARIGGLNGLLSVIGAIFASFAMLLPRQKASAAVSVTPKARDE